MSPGPEVLEALQKRDIEDLAREMRAGFLETHTLQRTTNGRLLKAEQNITELERANLIRLAERKYEKLIWYLVTVLVGVVIAMGGYILFHHNDSVSYIPRTADPSVVG